MTTSKARASPAWPAETEGQASCVAVADEMDLRAQAAAGTSERMVVGLSPEWRPLFLAPAAYWWDRQTVESTDTVQPMSSAPSAAARSAARIRSQVPSMAHLSSRL